MEYLDFNFSLKKIPKAFFFSTFYYTFRGVSDLYSGVETRSCNHTY